MDEHWVCIGHSHVGALAKAAGESMPGGSMDVINFWDVEDLWAHHDGPRPLREDLAERVVKGQVVISAIGGSAHFVLGMVEHEQPFDFVLSTDPDLPLDQTRELLPLDAVRQTLSDLAAPLLRGVSVLAGLVNGPVFQVAPPPPRADVVHARTVFNFAPEHFIGKTDLPTPKWQRYKMWRLHCEVIEDYCNEHGVKFMGAPAGAIDDDGFIRPILDADGMHGTAEYGRLVLEDIRRAL
jgi:hypothetical protein